MVTNSNGNFEKFKRIHFVGTGGIGVSAIARMCLLEGKRVTGSDRAPSEITDELIKLGAKITFGQQGVSEIPKDTDLIIYTAAIEVAEPTLLSEIKKLSIPSLSYSEALGEISKDKYTVAIAGTHGKTTTTGMVATALIDAGLSPTVIIGSILNREKSNFVFGKSDVLVVEADEYRRSFLSLSPKILVINNLDLDHLDYFKDLKDIQSAYAELANKVPKDGFIITDFSDPNVAPVLESAKATVLDYRSADVTGLSLPVPGEHNIKNAQVTLTVGAVLGIPREKICEALKNFQGTWRRFEKVGTMKSDALVYDDYAHNPQKISALIASAREFFPGKKLTVVFQPHLYSRTKTLFSGFVEALSKADRIIVADIFPAREPFDSSISSKMLADAIVAQNKNVSYFQSFDAIVQELKKSARADDVVITVGAGDIYKIGGELVKGL
ncbi:MAG: Mur ligase domain-containing protein [Patescibacteria group bacterium]